MLSHYYWQDFVFTFLFYYLFLYILYYAEK